MRAVFYIDLQSHDTDGTFPVIVNLTDGKGSYGCDFVLSATGVQPCAHFDGVDVRINAFFYQHFVDYSHVVCVGRGWRHSRGQSV